MYDDVGDHDHDGFDDGFDDDLDDDDDGNELDVDEADGDGNDLDVDADDEGGNSSANDHNECCTGDPLHIRHHHHHHQSHHHHHHLLRDHDQHESYASTARACKLEAALRTVAVMANAAIEFQCATCRTDVLAHFQTCAGCGKFVVLLHSSASSSSSAAAAASS
eukprot:3944276-Karenia_brevis.AAC.1